MKKHGEIIGNFNAKLATLSDEKQQVEEIIEFAFNYGDSYGEQITPLLEKGIEIAKSIGFETGEIICYYNLVFFNGGKGHSMTSTYTTSMSQLLEMLEKIKHDPYWYSMGLNMLAYHHWFKGEYEKAFNIAFETLKLTRETPDKNSGWHYFALGIFYFDTKDFENSEAYYKQSYDSFNQYNQQYGKARASNGLASVAIQKMEMEKAIPLLEFASGVYRDLGHHAGLSRALNDMALLEKVKKNYGQAIRLFNESIDLRKEINHVQGLITSLTELGEVYVFLEEFDTALEYLGAAIEYSFQANAKQKSMRINKLMYDIHKKLNNIPLALKHFEEYYELKTQLMGDEASNNIKRLQTNFAKEKSEKEAEIERLKNVELKKAYEVIEQKNKDIHDSIHYASRIQRSLLPTEKFIQRLLSEVKIKN